MSSGFCKHPPQPTIYGNQPEVCSFIKDDHTATGAVGLLTYDLFHKKSSVCSQRMAIMFSVPYDRNLYKNQLAVGVVDQSQACDENLYKQMYEKKDTKSFVHSVNSGSGLEYSAQYFTLRAAMSTNGKAIVKVEVHDKL